jgi:hypothetical protein
MFSSRDPEAGRDIAGAQKRHPPSPKPDLVLGEDEGPRTGSRCTGRHNVGMKIFLHDFDDADRLTTQVIHDAVAVMKRNNIRPAAHGLYEFRAPRHVVRRFLADDARANRTMYEITKVRSLPAPVMQIVNGEASVAVVDEALLIEVPEYFTGYVPRTVLP